MRALSAVILTSALCLGVTVPAVAAESPQLILSDPGYPLWEIRPQERHVYVLTLEGDWKSPPDHDAVYYVNVEFPDGGTVEQRIGNDDHLFRRGDVRCLLIEYQWKKHHFERGDKLAVFVTRRDAASVPDDQEVVSNRLEVEWPFDRKVVRLPPRTRFTPREPIDAFHPEGDESVAPPKPPPPPDK